MLGQREATLLIRDAYRRLGVQALRDLLPETLFLAVGSHDTGCQPSITARAEGLPPVLVWRGSVWYSQCYEFNDQGKVLGIQPQCTWAETIVAKFLDDVSELYAAAQTQAALKRASDRVAAERRYSEAAEAYRALLS